MLRRVLSVVLTCLLLSACTSGGLEEIGPPLAIDGTYLSAEAVGSLGVLEMVIRKRANSVRVFQAQLTGPDLEISPSGGRGTLGNDHLVLNFEIGALDDFYFQGFVQQAAGGAIESIDGSFIFPEGEGELPVLFERTGDAPPEEE